MTRTRTLQIALAALLAACASEPTPPPKPVSPPATATPLPEPPPIQTQPTKSTATPPAPSLNLALPDAPPPPTSLPATLSMAQVEKTFGFHRRYFNHIYLEHLKRKPKLSGTMLVSFSINPDGSTANARLDHSTLTDAAFEQAILKQIADTRFPPATGVTPVQRYPLEFSPR